MDRIGISPEQVVIEITGNQPAFDFDTMRIALPHYRRMCFRIAMDDPGQPGHQ